MSPWLTCGVASLHAVRLAAAAAAAAAADAAAAAASADAVAGVDAAAI